MEHLEPNKDLGELGNFGEASQRPVRQETANFYRILDVDTNATRLQIREAYIRLKSTYGAGSAALYSLISEEEAREQLLKVEEAFRVLSDDVQRRAHDAVLGLGGRHGAPGATAAMEASYGLGGGLDQFGAADTNWDDQTSDEAVIRTTRSTLTIINLAANKANAEEVQRRFQAILDESDPGDGDMFKRLREAAEVSEDEMQGRIKVSIGYLRAIESNRFDQLPQAVYVKGFLRSYFRYLAVPESERLVTAFAARLSDWQVNRKS